MVIMGIIKHLCISRENLVSFRNIQFKTQRNDNVTEHEFIPYTHNVIINLYNMKINSHSVMTKSDNVISNSYNVITNSLALMSNSHNVKSCHMT